MKCLSIVLLTILLLPSYISAEIDDNFSVEIFDIEAEKVIKIIHKTTEMQTEIEKYVDHITGIYKGLNPVPQSGYMVKIPLNPKIKIDNEWLQSEVDTVIIIIPEDKSPYLLTFDEENLPRVFLFDEDINQLLNELDFDPDEQ
ncbi:hypothetical protein E3U55_04315 [Filobacillus milosensis]|uniref:DUF3888 domain-containing protein n=1 Tax=Filobacillus milosensis TaxID=94137 RepID=A0A4Y8ISY6_9BACI|nr:hypothetical protein [Filobacillus milosensis]TFB24043.1 hypothetical protein E3U55_04315 [Filobacillus milosensis]